VQMYSSEMMAEGSVRKKKPLFGEIREGTD
jgi:hypothetical protein